MRPNGARERPERYKRNQKDEQKSSATENTGDDGEKQIEHFFYGEGPQNIPVAGEVAAISFENVDVEGERCKKRAREAASFLGNDEILNMREVQDAEHR